MSGADAPRGFPRSRTLAVNAAGGGAENSSGPLDRVDPDVSVRKLVLFDGVLPSDTHSREVVT
jgi:hypothetical protein